MVVYALAGALCKTLLCERFIYQEIENARWVPPKNDDRLVKYWLLSEKRWRIELSGISYTSSCMSLVRGDRVRRIWLCEKVDLMLDEDTIDISGAQIERIRVYSERR